jgi:hypothetical protein
MTITQNDSRVILGGKHSQKLGLSNSKILGHLIRQLVLYSGIYGSQTS